MSSAAKADRHPGLAERDASIRVAICRSMGAHDAARRLPEKLHSVCLDFARGPRVGCTWNVHVTRSLTTSRTIALRTVRHVAQSDRRHRDGQRLRRAVAAWARARFIRLAVRILRYCCEGSGGNAGALSHRSGARERSWVSKSRRAEFESPARCIVMVCSLKTECRPRSVREPDANGGRGAWRASGLLSCRHRKVRGSIPPPSAAGNS